MTGPEASSKRRYDMRDYTGKNFADRLQNSKKAKQLLLQKASEAPKHDDPAALEKAAARQTLDIAREAARAQRAAEKAAAAREKAEREAKEASEKAEHQQRMAQATAEQKAALSSEQKAARDARYAARKSRKK
jgi:Family of unknown function (DUF6481)